MIRIRHYPALGLLCLLAACTGAKSLYGQAHTAPQYAKAVLEHHNAIGTQVADLIDDPVVSEQTKTKLRTAYRLTVCDGAERAQATPTATCSKGPSYKLDDAVKTYESVRDAKTEAEITAAVERLVPLLTDLINAIAGAK
jgi:hypothetical protein